MSLAGASDVTLRHELPAALSERARGEREDRDGGAGAADDGEDVAERSSRGAGNSEELAPARSEGSGRQHGAAAALARRGRPHRLPVAPHLGLWQREYPSAIRLRICRASRGHPLHRLGGARPFVNTTGRIVYPRGPFKSQRVHVDETPPHWLCVCAWVHQRSVSLALPRRSITSFLLFSSPLLPVCVRVCCVRASRAKPGQRCGEARAADGCTVVTAKFVRLLVFLLWGSRALLFFWPAAFVARTESPIPLKLLRLLCLFSFGALAF